MLNILLYHSISSIKNYSKHVQNKKKCIKNDLIGSDPQTTYQVLQLFFTTAPGLYILSPCTQGHMVSGTHWPWWSWTSPGEHWQPGTHVLEPDPPPASSQLQLSEQELPQVRPHSWYNWPPEHWTAGRTGQEARTLECYETLSHHCGGNPNVPQCFHYERSKQRRYCYSLFVNVI